MGAKCIKCGREVTNDEAGMTKKLINRGAVSFYCMDCLADHFEVPVKNLYEKLEQYRADGCTLFARRK